MVHRFSRNECCFERSLTTSVGVALRGRFRTRTLVAKAGLGRTTVLFPNAGAAGTLPGTLGVTLGTTVVTGGGGGGIVEFAEA